MIKSFQKMLLVLVIASLLISCTQQSADLRNQHFKGIFIDAARTVESLDYYFKLIDFCEKQGLNVIVFRLTDDSGSAYRFKSHPELKMLDGAFSTSDLVRLVMYADSNGIEMIPEIESFGHTKYITDTEKYKHLSDGVIGSSFNAVSPLNQETRDLMKALYTEISSIFTSGYFHIGCDEVSWGASDLSKNALNTNSKHQIWADYINGLNQYIKGLGKKAIIWGDVPVKEQETLNLLDKDIVIMDWNYRDTDKKAIAATANNLVDKGFQIIGCPAINWCRWGPRVGSRQFDNINAYAEVFGKLKDPNNLGVIMSNWVPQRYLQGSQWDTYYIGAEILNNNGNYNYMDALPAFVKNHFGATWNSTWKSIYTTAYESAPESFCGQKSKFLLWMSGSDIKRILKKNELIANPFGKIKDDLIACRSKVTKNQQDYNDFLLTIEFINHVYNRQNDLVRFANSENVNIKTAADYMQKVAREDQELLAKLDVAWGRGRRSRPSVIRGDKDYMMSFFAASIYSKKLSKNGSELMNLLN